jgi:hypothetical protein
VYGLYAAGAGSADGGCEAVEFIGIRATVQPKRHSCDREKRRKSLVFAAALGGRAGNAVTSTSV